jgi:hypothetical protein
MLGLSGLAKWNTEPFGEGAAYGGRFVRFGPWRDLAVENSYVGAVSDQGEVMLDFWSQRHGCQTDEPAIGVAIPQGFDSVGRVR